MSNILFLSSTVPGAIAHVPVLDLVGVGILLICILIGFLSKTWLSLWSVIIFTILFTIAWFFILPPIATWIEKDALEAFGLTPVIDFVYSYPTTIEELKNAGVIIPIEGYTEASLTLNIHFYVEINSIEEFFQVLVVDSPFITPVNKDIYSGDTASQIAFIVCDAAAWIILIPCISIVGSIIAFPTYFLAKKIFFRGKWILLDKRFNPRILGALVGFLFGFWLIFTITQSLAVWSPGISYFSDHYTEVTKLFEENMHIKMDVFGEELEKIATYVNPRSSVLFGWMGGHASTFGNIVLKSGLTANASDTFLAYCQAIIGDAGSYETLIHAINNIPQDASIFFNSIIVSLPEDFESFMSVYGSEIYDILDSYGISVSGEINASNIGEIIASVLGGSYVIPDDSTLLSMLEGFLSGGSIPSGLIGSGGSLPSDLSGILGGSYPSIP